MILARPLSPAELGRLTEALYAARRAMHTGTPEEIAKGLAVLFTAFPDPRIEGKTAEAKHRRDKLYFEAVERKPLEAIYAAVGRLVRGEVPWVRPTFLPTPAELSRVVEEERAVIAAEGVRIKRLLDGRTEIEKPPQDVRDQQTAQAGEIARGMRRSLDDLENEEQRRRVARIAEANDRLFERERAKYPNTPPGISPMLHALLTRKHPDGRNID